VGSRPRPRIRLSKPKTSKTVLEDVFEAKDVFKVATSATLMRRKGEMLEKTIFRSFEQIFLSSQTVMLSYGYVRYSFICQGTSTRRQRSDFFGLRVKLPPVTTSLEAIPFSLGTHLFHYLSVIKVPYPRTHRQKNLPAYLHTNPSEC